MSHYDLVEAIDIAGRAKGELEPDLTELQAATDGLLAALVEVGRRGGFQSTYDDGMRVVRWQTAGDAVAVALHEGRIVCVRTSDKRVTAPKVCFNAVSKLWEEAEYTPRAATDRPRRSAVAVVVEEMVKLLRAHV